MQIGTSGVYVKGSAEAAALYMDAFGLTLGYHVKNPDGSFYHSELMCGDKEILSVIESDARQVDQTVQLTVILDSEADVRRAFALLAEGGTVDLPVGPLPWSDCGGAVHDRFGVWWYVTVPQHYPADDFDPSAPVR